MSKTSIARYKNREEAEEMDNKISKTIVPGSDAPPNMPVPIKDIILEEVKPGKGLVQTIKKYGLLQNVILTPCKAPEGKYRIIAGRRRIQALIRLGKDQVQAMIIRDDPEGEAMISLIENMQRSDNPGLEARMLKRLLDAGRTQEGLAALLQVSQAQISKRIRLLKLTPKLFEKLNRGDLKPSIARELAKLPQKDQAAYEKNEKITLKDIREATRQETLKSLDLARAEDIHAPGSGDSREAPTKGDQTQVLGGNEALSPRTPLNIDRMERIMLAQARKMPFRPGQIGLSNWIRNFFAAFRKGDYDTVIKPPDKKQVLKSLKKAQDKAIKEANERLKKSHPITPAKNMKYKPLKGEMRCPICHRPYPLEKDGMAVYDPHMQNHGWVWSNKEQKYVPPGGKV